MIGTWNLSKLRGRSACGRTFLRLPDNARLAQCHRKSCFPSGQNVERNALCKSPVDVLDGSTDNCPDGDGDKPHRTSVRSSCNSSTNSNNVMEGISKCKS